MANSNTRLYFIDAMRAWAILMMLQGHFIDGLLADIFRNDSNVFFNIWKYFRGITAPVFFTVSGFIFTYLLVKGPQLGWDNPRVKKGIGRGIQLLAIGYLLRLNISGLLKGQLYASFFLVDVLHCIGLSLLGIIGMYLATIKFNKWLFPLTLLSATLILFVFEPFYKNLDYSVLPQWLGNYFTRGNGSVFTIMPWFGYTAFGAFISVLFNHFKHYRYLYATAIPVFTVIGLMLMFQSSDFFFKLEEWTGMTLFSNIYNNNYLFIRLGDVLLVFAIFMAIRNLIIHSTFLRIGQNTLAIYIVHFIILYGSFTGLGLYRFFNHSLSPQVVLPGALLFMVVCTFLALAYDKWELIIKERFSNFVVKTGDYAEANFYTGMEILRNFTLRVMRLLGLVKS